MKSIKMIVSSLVMLSMLSFGLQAVSAASLLGLATEVNVSAGVSGNASGNMIAPANVAVPANMTVNGQSNAYAGTQAVQASTDAKADVSAQTSSSSQPVPVSLNLDLAADGSFDLTQSDVSASANSNLAGSSSSSVSALPMISEGSVSSDNDLDVYAAGIIQSDPNVVAVSASNNDVTVTYKEPARLFGFIPTSINASATVDAQGNVSVHYPWYRFLTKVNDADLQASLAAEVPAGTDISASASTKAQVIAAFYNTLRANAGI